MKVVLIRFSSIGDIVLTSPIIRCIKQQLPDAELVFLTKLQFCSLLTSHPDLSAVLSLEKDLGRLRTEFDPKTDIVLDLHKNIRSKRIVRMLGAKAYSFDKLNLKKWLFSQFKINRMPKKHLVDRYFEGIAALGVSNDYKGLDFYLDPNTDVDRFDLPRRFYTYAIGGTYATKRMPNDKILELVESLEEPVVLIGGPTDQENAAWIADRSEKAINLCGSLNIHESALLMSKASHVFCHDSGMMHIAAALDLPLSVIWGNTHPLFGMGPLRDTTSTARTFQHQVQLSCRPCSKLGYNRCPKKHFGCMNYQNVEEIVQNCDSVESAQ